jgi:thioredoxin reductase
MFDVLIVGGGPAALAGAVYLARQKHSFALIAPTIGGQVSWSSDVENYLGFHLLDGVELVKRFRAHLEDYQQAFVLKEGETVTTLEKTDTGFRATKKPRIVLKISTIFCKEKYNLIFPEGIFINLTPYLLKASGS